MSNLQAQSAESKRDAQIAALCDHCCTISSPKDVFKLLDLLREMGAVTYEEIAAILHLYWSLDT